MRQKRGSFLDILQGAGSPAPPQLGGIGGPGGAMQDQDPTGVGLGPPTEMGGMGMGMDSSMLGNEDLSQMVDPEEEQFQQMQAMMDDPNLPPAQRQMLEQQMAMAARKRLSGI